MCAKRCFRGSVSLPRKSQLARNRGSWWVVRRSGGGEPGFVLLVLRRLDERHLLRKAVDADSPGDDRDEHLVEVGREARERQQSTNRVLDRTDAALVGTADGDLVVRVRKLLACDLVEPRSQQRVLGPRVAGVADPALCGGQSIRGLELAERKLCQWVHPAVERVRVLREHAEDATRVLRVSFCGDRLDDLEGVLDDGPKQPLEVVSCRGQ